MGKGARKERRANSFLTFNRFQKSKHAAVFYLGLDTGSNGWLSCYGFFKRTRHTRGKKYEVNHRPSLGFTLRYLAAKSYKVESRLYRLSNMDSNLNAAKYLFLEFPIQHTIDFYNLLCNALQYLLRSHRVVGKHNAVMVIDQLPPDDDSTTFLQM